MIVKTKQFALKPMSAEEAVLQLELVGHDFFVFRNAETGEINVVYRRRDGDYGLIEPASRAARSGARAAAPRWPSGHPRRSARRASGTPSCTRRGARASTGERASTFVALPDGTLVVEEGRRRRSTPLADALDGRARRRRTAPRRCGAATTLWAVGGARDRGRRAARTTRRRRDRARPSRRRRADARRRRRAASFGTIAGARGGSARAATRLVRRRAREPARRRPLGGRASMPL